MSTFPPKQCGLATFTASLLGALRSTGTHDHPQGITFGIIALSDPRDGIVYDGPALDYELRLDRHMPSPAMLQAVHFIHKAGYSHVIIQQVGKTLRLARLACRPGRHVQTVQKACCCTHSWEHMSWCPCCSAQTVVPEGMACCRRSLQEFGVTPIMWQLADLARWLDPRISVLTVVHSPRAAPTLQERGLLREMSRHSERLVVMTWFGWHSLVAAYGIPPQQVVFVPHGIDIPEQAAPDADTATRRDSASRLLLRQLLANAGMVPDLVVSSCVVTFQLPKTAPALGSDQDGKLCLVRRCRPCSSCPSDGADHPPQAPGPSHPSAARNPAAAPGHRLYGARRGAPRSQARTCAHGWVAAPGLCAGRPQARAVAAGFCSCGRAHAHAEARMRVRHAL